MHIKDGGASRLRQKRGERQWNFHVSSWTKSTERDLMLEIKEKAAKKRKEEKKKAHEPYHQVSIAGVSWLSLMREGKPWKIKSRHQTVSLNEGRNQRLETGRRSGRISRQSRTWLLGRWAGVEANTFCWNRFESKTVVTAVHKTADAAAIIPALATTSNIGAWTWQSHWVLQSVILRGFHELLVLCVAEVRRVAIVHVARMCLSWVLIYSIGLNTIVEVAVHGGNGVV